MTELGLDRFFRRSKRNTKPSRLYRDRTARLQQPDVLDKPHTRKLLKFWANTEGSSIQSPPSRAVSGVTLPPSFSLGISDPFDLSLVGSSFGLPTVAQDPVKLGAADEERLISMDPARLAPESRQHGEKKQKAIKDAKDMYALIRRNCERTNTAVPPYDFIELIGKGAFGRVYKCRVRSTGELVAVKIVNTDEADYQQNSLDKDDTIRDFRKEVTILQQLKDNNAKNVNMIHDAFDLQEQLWIVSDYCTGGSIRTLMRAQPATHPGLEEQFIIPIARELAQAMKSVHDIGVIHRDIKCTNVYVTEEGEIQLGDFGIVGVMDDGVNKRQTMIGTPHYMPREMHMHGSGNQVAEAYGTEVDVWSFGCSVYEMATGQPPNAVTRQNMLKIELLNAPRLEGGTYSQDLRDFVAFCLNSNPKERPTAEQVLGHPYVANTQQRYPSRKLVDLIHRYKAWEFSGGWRQSLFFAGGAAPPIADNKVEATTEESHDFDDWNFSTSDNFNEQFEKRFSQLIDMEDTTKLPSSTQSGNTLPPINTDLSAWEQLQQRHKDLSADRGERSLERIFTPESEPYELHTPTDDLASPISDLPLRKSASGAPVRESHILIDLDTGDDLPTFNFDFGDGPTLKAKSFNAGSSQNDDEEDFQYGPAAQQADKRATMEWTFPAVKRSTMDWKFPATTVTPMETDEVPKVRPTLKHTATEPIGQFGDCIHPAPYQSRQQSPTRDSMVSMIDLDLGLGDPAEIIRPSTANSVAGSTMTDATSGNPFDLEDDPAQNEIDRNRFSYHKPWQSEGGQLKRSSHRSIPMHTRGSSLSSTASEMERPSTSESDDVFNFNYNKNVAESMRAQLNGISTHGSVDLNQWPDFGPNTGFGGMPPYQDPLDELVARHALHEKNGQTNGVISQQLGMSARGQPVLVFPRLQGPHPAALREDADPSTVGAELDRLLNDFGDGLDVTANALQSFLIDEDYGGFDTNESGLDTEEERA